MLLGSPSAHRIHLCSCVWATDNSARSQYLSIGVPEYRAVFHRRCLKRDRWLVYIVSIYRRLSHNKAHPALRYRTTIGWGCWAIRICLMCWLGDNAFFRWSGLADLFVGLIQKQYTFGCRQQQGVFSIRTYLVDVFDRILLDGLV